MRHVVVVKPPDDHPGFTRVFGPFKSADEAESFAASVTEKVQKEADWADESTGWAYVQTLEPPRRRDAAAWALRGERIR